MPVTIWGISDLHLSFARPDRRERYAERWRDHATKIEREWRAVVRPEDLVLMPGDLSMARNHRELQPDLDWIARLPGTKVLSAGNHDRWFNRVEAIRPMMRRSMGIVGGDARVIGDVIVCAARGAPVPAEDALQVSPEVQTQLDALDRALEHAATLRQPGQPLFVLWHYPPFDERRHPGPWVARFEAAGVTACVYGHLHAQAQWSRTVQGVIGGVHYHCVAADAVGFRPLRLGTVEGGSTVVPQGVSS